MCKEKTDRYLFKVSNIAPDKEAKIDRIFSGYNQSTPGYAVAIVKKGIILLMKTYGMADPKKKVSITSDTRFPIGSNSKQFTCMAILLLEEQGKLNIGDPISNYLPELPVYITDIRPGFVDTAMAKGDGKFWVASVEKAGLQIFKAIHKKKKVVHITRRWKWIALILKNLPSSLYEKL